MLTRHDVSAIMGAIKPRFNSYHINEEPSELPRVYFDIWSLSRCCMAHGALLVTASVQSSTRIYILFTSVMTHLITRLIVYLRGMRENFIYVFSEVIYSTMHQ